MNILILEDEQLTAEDLADTIQSIDKNYHILDTIVSVKEAVHYLNTQAAPDLIFSDIQLIDGLSFRIFEQVKISCPIVFCTAFDEYALQAFQANGVEYLLKPFNQAMVANVFEKLKQLQNLPFQQPTWLQQMLTNFQKPEKIKSLLVYMADKIKPIAVEKVALFYVAQEKTYLQTFENEVHLLNQTLNELEMLVGDDFFRANRQTLIHRQNLLEIEQYFSRKLLLKPLQPHSEAIVVSKEKAAELIRWVKGET